MTNKKPRVLVTGATGQVGRGVVRRLLEDPTIEVVATSRNPRTAGDLGVKVVLLDLDNLETIAPALEGVDRLFILTGYTVDMLRQSKALIDHARLAGVSYIVHLGACGGDDTDVAHYGWHQFVERYIEWSGISYTHLRPEVFLQNLLGYSGVRTVTQGVIRHYVGAARQCWVDADDVANVAAICLREPEPHAGKVYRLGYDLKSHREIADIMSQVLGKPFRDEPHAPEEFLDNVLRGGADPAYMDCVYRSYLRLSGEGIVGSEEVFSNYGDIAGVKPTLVADFIKKNAVHFDY